MTSITRRQACAAALAWPLSASLARAQAAWPSRPVSLVIPFPPGGHTDAIGRMVADHLARRLGQPVVIENRPGVNGSLGTDAVTRAAADGHTLVMGGIGTLAINPAMNPNVRYDARRDLTHIALVARSPNVLLASPRLAAQSLREVIAQARAQPRGLNFALTGIGSSGHLAMELLKQSAGVDFNAVPYKGDAPATADLLGGQVDLLFLNSVVAVPHVKSGKLRALAVTSGTRNPLLPEVPTLVETGLPGAVADSWTSLAGPPGLPGAVVERLNQEVASILALPDVRERLAASGTEAMAGSPAQAQAFVLAEIEKWGRVIKAGNMRAE
ncbi:MAG: tripartite tricarboxylate transporter substrate binding protein [Burkholderiaceae bacterium]|nr:tripartite tricarboxylate transporter substrate binding protein [Burkholderiaceae bacterium]